MAGGLEKAGTGISVPPAYRDEPLTGIGCLVLGITFFSLQDVIMRLLSGSYPVHEVLFVRSLTAMPLFVALVLATGSRRRLSPGSWPILTLRGGIVFTASTLYYLAIAALPLATCVSLYFTAPLFVTVMSAAFLDEKVGIRRVSAILLGFLGALVVLAPGSESFHWAAVLPIGAAICYAASQTLTRRLGQSFDAPQLALFGNLGVLTAAALSGLVLGHGGFAREDDRSLGFLLRAWALPGTHDLLLMMACGLIAFVGLTLLAQAYRVTRVTTVAPFEYTSLFWSVTYGFLLFSEVPSVRVVGGVALIIAAGLFVLFRERQLALAARKAATAKG
ncbi:MAG: DMT family transporter [Hyphomicrobiaceae bacterium]